MKRQSILLLAAVAVTAAVASPASAQNPYPYNAGGRTSRNDRRS